MRKVGFEASIVELKVKRLVSQDKSLRVVLEIDSPNDDLVDSLNRLFKADSSIGVAIAEVETK